MGRGIEFFIPSNRVNGRGQKTHVDGMNEIIAQNRSNRYHGARIEKENVSLVATYARAAMGRERFKPIEGKAIVHVTFVEINHRRDVSNIYGGLKWVLDGLTRPRGGKGGAGLIYDDSPRYCECIPSVSIDRENPGVIVRVMEVDADAKA